MADKDWIIEQLNANYQKPYFGRKVSVSFFLIDALQWICSFINLPNTDIDDE